jgi:hypothetical protein
MTMTPEEFTASAARLKMIMIASIRFHLKWGVSQLQLDSLGDCVDLKHSKKT